jgi:hypothetical protein
MKDYPEEFIGRKKYKLVKIYKNYALYETDNYKTCFNLETIERVLDFKKKNAGG